ncbi:acetyl-CoA synthetase-like protein [Daedaleopsis nitida]|nr:acetyl-CoA synthetase-like protein [Daedaleopsis nitida]
MPPATTTTQTFVVTTPQGVGSKTWTPPPFYSDPTIPELYAFHAKNSPTHPAIAYDEENDTVRSLSYTEVFHAIRRAAKIVSDNVQPSLPAGGPAVPVPVVGILAVADYPTLHALLVGTMYLGCTPFPISARNSPAAVAHLVRATAVHALFVSGDAAMQRLALEAQAELARDGYAVRLLPLPELRDVYNDAEEGDAVGAVKMGRVDGDQTALIIHSSGSTSFPKPIRISHRNFARWAYFPYTGDTDMCGVRLSIHGLPLFHVMGAFSITWTVGTGLVATVFRPTTPPIVTTPENVIEGVVNSKSEAIFCVPSIVEAWAREPETVTALQKLRCVTFAGAPLNKEVGDSLRKQNVKIVPLYGLTEAGGLTTTFNTGEALPSEDWEYFTLNPNIHTTRIYQEGQPGVFELVLLDSPTISLNAYNTEVDGRPAYATSDLMLEYPTNPRYMKIYGRADDQIILSTGEKAIMKRDPHLSAALVFGRGRVQNGVIVQPKEPFDPADEEKLAEFRNKIWPSVERANNFAPSHSRIFKEMILVTKPSKPFQYTAKGTPRRHICLNDYAEEVDEVYKRVEESSQVDVKAPAEWTEDTTREYVSEVVKRVLEVENINDQDDLFQLGCDSLQATYIRNTILHALRTTTKAPVNDVPLNFVYNHPTIAMLSVFLHRILTGEAFDPAAERKARLAQMRAFLDKYGSDFPTPQWAASAAPAAAKETLVITGTTGRLGAHLLAQSLQRGDVVHVYALNRGTPGAEEELAAKQREAFKTWGLDAGLLAEKVSFHAADLAKPRFGLDEETFDAMRESVTAIVHNAWRVDFSVSLISFEPLIAGTRNFVDFALSSPVPGGPRVLFVSSITAAYNYSAGGAVPESIDFGPELAVGLGYGESKWVTEQVLKRAAEATGLRITAVRGGQLSGDTRIGGWNVKEWVPAIVRASKRLRCVPVREDTVSWVPVDIAASAILEMLHSDGRIFHITLPRPAAWNDVVVPIAERLGVPAVPSSEWMDKLRADARRAETTGDHDSAHTLIDFFDETMSGGETLFGTEKAVAASRSMAALAPIGREDALKWLSYWESVGFLTL